MANKDKNRLIRIISATLLLLLVYVFSKIADLSLTLQALLYLLPYLLVGHDVLVKAVKKMSKGKVFSEHFLMSLATLGAFALSFMTGKPEFAEAVFVMIFYQVGELFENIA